MTWLHNWVGIFIGTVSFAVFWMGTLTVFSYEIDKWMLPETRIELADAPDPDLIFDSIVSSVPNDRVMDVSFRLPTSREPVVNGLLFAERAGFKRVRIDPRTGEQLPERGSRAGTQFIYPMHVTLYLPGNWGWWIVLFASLSMLLLLISGVIIHRKLFTDFFTFRPKRKLRRSSLDLHNVTGAIFLPFHFLIIFSGLVVWAGFYASFPWTLIDQVAKTEVSTTYDLADAYSYYPSEPEPAGTTAEMLPLSFAIARAEAIWTDRYNQTAKADFIAVHNVGDANARIDVHRFFPKNRSEAFRDFIRIDGISGDVVEDREASAVQAVRSWLAGFHHVQFGFWVIRWLYFVGGLAGCVMIGSGFIFWTASRRRKADERDPLKVSFVTAVSIGSTTGLIIATGIFFVINRLLPTEFTFLELSRPAIEMRVFFAVWAITFLHSAVRQNNAWRDQALAIAVISALAIILNWVTTGDHVLVSISEGLWAVAGMDAMLALTALLSANIALQLNSTTDRRSGKERTVSSDSLIGG